MKSGNKNRVLPTWMTAQVAEKQEVPAKNPRKRRKAAVTMTAATRPAAQRTTYCMNEAELVDVALGILIEGRQPERPEEHTALAAADKPECSPTHSGPLWPLGSQEEDEDKEEASLPPSRASSLGLGVPDSACSPPQVDEEEDALKYVREIFFS
ncbi:cell cycle regulator of non-homologous end joining [Echinops telfairi]|uniref:Cell cycle regulator of non-homologous end joining n=8 Tax=Echinops telfairi TaxID=9371 RepID=A0AC55CYV4_ECHTE|nr:cell cycle regulator of non-homologous end joining [Echinops telfairi]XP_045144678.1 cell cycle regulator of non-homologous end joining [Echinops telfairi]XP_045144679.1 cell cycle regulator of non-homologous end joining [Echinops telfairi]XP_045144680.1 cell cycle regulator of non-homologous end joining [Echinops telfairi]XP_045144682.1 cell cycle regulator of non-homologous end joining [Echinops telfairi]XP_045144683.1 cell cycle regulator of non-homologous end joining [Echinops telfairi]